MYDLTMDLPIRLSGCSLMPSFSAPVSARRF